MSRALTPLSFCELWVCLFRGTQFIDEAGREFRFAGTNCYYLSYQDPLMVEDVCARASANGFTVLRTWAFLDIGHPDGSESVGGGAKNGVWFQALDPSTNKLVYNEAGLQHLDAVLVAAAKHKIRLILTLSNNWVDFGGADQYVRWETLVRPDYASSARHDDFFTSPWQEAAYVAYATHLMTRVNSVTGVRYKDDPTIFSWELVNEPRCAGSGAYASSNNCTLNYAVYNVEPVAFKIPPWVARVSAALKGVDGNHLLAVGDEGFLCETYQDDPDMTGDCYVGTDYAGMTSIATIDFGSMHLYPDAWGHDATWGTAWITNHTRIAHAIGKPVVLGEFGMKNNEAATYAAWGEASLSGCVLDAFWMLCGLQDSGGDNGWYPNYDGFCVYCKNSSDPNPPSGDAAACGVLSAHAAAMAKA